jgi:hypothetical protein
MTNVIYLASPIDQGRDGTKETARDVLHTYDCAVFDPGAGWTVPRNGKPNRVLQAANIALLRECDGILAILNPAILTIGVILELIEADIRGMARCVYAPDLKPSWALALLGIPVYSNLEDAVQYLKQELKDD